MFSSELFSFQGRASRSKFWLVFLLSIFVSFVVVLFTLLATPALMIMGTFSPTVASIVSILLYVLMIPMWWISIATSVKRFHDRNKSGWWYLIVLVPFLGALWLIIENGFLKGTTGTNNFGEDPLVKSSVIQSPSMASPSFSHVPASSGPSTLKLPLLIIGGIILVALLGRVGWAYYQVKNDEARATLAGTIAQTSTTAENFAIHYDDTNSTSTQGLKMKLDISGPTFTSSQLAGFKSDMISFYLKYKDKDETAKNTEPLKTQIGKEMDAIFLKDLGVTTMIAAGDFGGSMMLMQPQVAQIMSDIEAQYSKTVVTTSAPTAKLTANGLTNLNVKAGDNINFVWSSTNANSFKRGFSITGCTNSQQNSPAREQDETASGSRVDILSTDYIGCTAVLTYTAKNITTGKQATATVIIKVSTSAPVTTTITPANKCSVITMTNALSTVPARQSIDFPAQGATLIAGQTYTTSWLDEKYNSPESYPVYLSTTPNNDPLNSLGTAYKAQCSFTFTIPSSATPGSNYRLMFSRNGMTSIYSNVFTISK